MKEAATIGAGTQVRYERASIPMHRPDVVLDTSAILNLSKDPVLATMFVERAREKGHCVLLAYAAVEECLAVGHAQGLVEFARWAVNLDRQLPLLFSFGLPHNHFMEREWREPELTTTACDPRTRAHFLRLSRQVLSSPGSSVEDFAAVRDGVGGWKARRRVDDRLARLDLASAVKGKVLSTDYKALLHDFSASLVPEWVIEPILRRVAGAPAGSGAIVCAAPARYRAAICWGALGFLTMVSQAVPDTIMRTDPLFRVLKRDKNDFYDCMVAASAAYAEFFVTDDPTLLARCVFLRRKGVVRFKTLTVANYTNVIGCPTPDRQ